MCQPLHSMHSLGPTNATNPTPHLVTPIAVGAVTARFILIELKVLCMVMVTVVVAPSLAPGPAQILLVVVFELTKIGTTNVGKETNPPTHR